MLPASGKGWIGLPVWVFIDTDGIWEPGTVKAASPSSNDPSSWHITVVTQEKNTINVTCKQLSNYEFDKVQRRVINNNTTCSDLAAMDTQNEPEMLNCLSTRYANGDIYTSTGPILIVLNPFQKVALYTDEIIKLYIEHGEQHRMNILPPHVYKIGDSAYRKMFIDPYDPDKRQDQTVVITGDSGAGKTECTKQLLHYLTAISTRVSMSLGMESVQGTEIEDLIIASNPISESFGNARTQHNANSSRFGRYIELLYSADGYLEGALLRTYLLEASRVTHQIQGDSNFHVFYELAAGLSTRDRTQLGFTAVDDFHYLNTSRVSDQSSLHLKNYTNLRAAMTTLNISLDTQEEVIKVLISILHLGNLSFEDNETTDGSVSCHIASDAEGHAELACRMLGFTEDSLKDAILRTELTVRGTTIIKQYDSKNAVCMRDRLARTLYVSLFKWMMVEINAALSQQTSGYVASKIGVLDIFGFESYQKNSFEQLCINYANEKLQELFNYTVFDREREVYEAEGLMWQSVSYPDNRERIDLFENKSVGLFTILNDAMKIPDSNDVKFAHAIYARSAGHPHCYATNAMKARNEFTVRHFAFDVTYTVENILEKNRGMREINFSAMFGTMSGASRKFSTDNLSISRQLSGELDSSSKENESIVKRGKSTAGIQIKKDMSIELRRAAASVSGRRSVKTSVGKKSKTICSAYVAEITCLISSINSTRCHFIRCIKPNNEGIPGTFDAKSVIRQVRTGGVISAVEAVRLGMPNRLPYAAFVSKYRSISHTVGKCPLTRNLFILLGLLHENSDLGVLKRTATALVEAVPMAGMILSSLFHDNSLLCPANPFAQIQIGNSVVLISSEFFEYMERIRRAGITLIAIRLQRVWKANRAVDTGSYVNTAALTSLLYFSHSVNLKVRRNTLAAIMIQRRVRTYLARMRWMLMLIRLRALQAHIRGYIARSVYQKKKRYNAAVKLQSAYRMYRDKRTFKRYVLLAITCQRIVRGWIARNAEYWNRRMTMRRSPQIALQEKVIALEKEVDSIKSHTSVKPRRARCKYVITAADFVPLVEGEEFIKICSNGKSRMTRVWLSADRRYLHWERKTFSMKKAEKRILDLATVTHVQRGQGSTLFRKCEFIQNIEDVVPRSFSLHCRDGRTLDLVAPTVELLESWVTALQFLVVDIYIIRRDLYNIWALLVTGEGVDEVICCLDVLQRTVDTTVKTALVPFHAFVTFWISLQCNRVHAEEVVEHIIACLPGIENAKYMTFQAFFCLVTSERNDGYDLHRQNTVYQDMTLPLSLYFISCSDGSTMGATSLKQVDPLDRYVRDLRNGVRGLEVHCWDGTGENKGIPVVANPSADPQCSISSEAFPEVSFYDFVAAVKTHAFVSNPYPLFLIIEIHCSKDIQWRMASILRDLMTPVLLHSSDLIIESQGSEPRLRSPSELKGKVILVLSNHKKKFSVEIPDKSAQCQKQDVGVSEEKSGYDDPASNEDTTSTTGVDDVDLLLTGAKKSKSDSKTDRKVEAFWNMDAKSKSTGSVDQDTPKSAFSDQGENDEEMAALACFIPSPDIFHDLLSLATLLSRGVNDLDAMVNLPSGRVKNNTLASCGEVDMLFHLSRNKAIPWIYHNSVCLSRVYPDERLEEATMLDPARAWASGQQLVSVDMHSCSNEEAIHTAHVVRGKFMDNGGCGYVLKPRYMHSRGLKPFPKAHLSVHVLSAQNLPPYRKSTVGVIQSQDSNELMEKFLDPYVVMEIWGLAQDKYTYSTITSGGSGRTDNPIWDEVCCFNHYYLFDVRNKLVLYRCLDIIWIAQI